MLLGLALVGLASAYGLKETVSSVKTEMILADLHKRGPLDIKRDFDSICLVSRIRRITYPSLIGDEDTEVLSEKGFDNAYEFIMQEPLTSLDDYDAFVELYKEVRAKELETQRDIWIKECSEVISSIKFSGDGYYTFKKRVIGISIDDDELIDRLYSETPLSKIAVKKGKAVFENGNSGKLHVWAFKGVRDQIDAEKLYKACCRAVGIDLI